MAQNKEANVDMHKKAKQPKIASLFTSSVSISAMHCHWITVTTSRQNTDIIQINANINIFVIWIMFRASL
jgi:hypothetical protein